MDGLSVELPVLVLNGSCYEPDSPGTVGALPLYDIPRQPETQGAVTCTVPDAPFPSSFIGVTVKV